MNSSEYNDIDRLFQDHLTSYEVEVRDRDALWRRIRRPDGRKRYFFMILIGLIGAVGLMASMKPNQVGIGGGHHETNSFVEYSNIEEADNLNALTMSASPVEGNVDVSLSNQVDIKTEQIASSLYSKIDDKSVEEFALSQESISSMSKPIEVKELNADSYSMSNHSATSMFGYSEEGTDVQQSDSDLSMSTQVDEKVSPLGEKNIYKTSNLEVIPKLYPEVNVDFQPIPNTLQVNNSGSKNPLNKCVVGPQPGGLYIDVNTSIFQPMDQVSLNADFIDQTAFQDTWEERNSALPSLSGGIAVGFEFPNGLDISIGVEYQKMESQYQYTQTISEITRVWDPMAYFFVDDQGQTVWVADSVTAINRYERTESLGSTTTLINLPLQVSYPLVRNGKWEIKATASGIFNIRMENAGYILREDLSLVSVDANNEFSFYKSKLGVSYELGAQFGYHIGERMELYASPRYRYNGSSLLLDSGALSLKRNFFGLKIGVQYDL